VPDLTHNRQGSDLGLTNYTEAFNAERPVGCVTCRRAGGPAEPVLRPFDVDHCKAIHRRGLQDVYEWVREFRTVDVGNVRNSAS
jgi:fido (protein-threonine AMPylation protein)